MPNPSLIMAIGLVIFVALIWLFQVLGVPYFWSPILGLVFAAFITVMAGVAISRWKDKPRRESHKEGK